MTDNIPSKKVLVCPECGVDMSGIDPEAHARSHWPDVLDKAKASKEAFKRQSQCISGGVTLAEYAKAHKEE